MNPSKPFERAVVIGGSIAGLLAARAAADRFREVIILEREVLEDNPEPRKGVPQGRHIHALLESGRNVLEKFFPGSIREIEQEGVNTIDFTADFCWHHFGVWKVRNASKVSMLLFTRPYLEWTIRKRVQALENVTLRDGVVVEDLLFSDDGLRVQGVRLNNGETLHAAVVLEASGRGSRVPAQLEANGYPAPAEETVGVDLAYTSRLYKPPAEFKQEWKLLVQYPRSPENWRAGFISCVEGEKWVVSLNGYFKDHAPTDEAGFLNFARELPRPDIYNYIKNAEPLTDAKTHKIPTNRWRHYEKLARVPEGLIPLGDSVCALNPIFGQGMSVAAGAADALHGLFEEQARRGTLKGVARRAHKRIAKVIFLPWFLTSTLDLHYPQATGKRPFGHGFLMWYIGHMLELTSSHPRINTEVSKVLNLRAGLFKILKPSVSIPVIAYGVRSWFTPLEKRANTDTRPELRALRA